MDKAIRKIEKKVRVIAKEHRGKHSEKKMTRDVRGVQKSLKSLEKMDKKQDKIVAKAKKMKKGKY